MTIAIERGDWLNIAPTGLSPQEVTTVSVNALRDNDDIASALLSTSAMDLVSDWSVGDTGGADEYDHGVIFRGVNVPRNAEITSAKITLTSGQAQVTVETWEMIGRIESDSSSIPSFSNFASFNSRTSPTVSTADWTLTAWDAVSRYDSDDFSGVIEELTKRDDWVSGSGMTIYARSKNAGVSFRKVTDVSLPTLTITYRSRGSEAVLLSVVKTDLNDSNSGNVDTDGVREPTDGEGVFVASAHTLAQLQSIGIWDNSAFTFVDSAPDVAKPFTLGPAAPVQTDDAIYFGILVSAEEIPFNNLVFDITKVATYAAGNDGIRWQYYNGSSFVDILLMQDNTANADPATGVYSPSFTKLGVNSISWGKMPLWATTAVQGITGYWIKGLFNVASAITTAEQGNRAMYTANSPYVEVQSTEILGDLPATIGLKIRGRSDDSMPIGWAAIGVRGVERGADFSPYINFAQTNNHSGITIAATGGAFAANSDAPANESINHTVTAASGTPGTSIATITIDNTLAWEYSGRFLPLIRTVRLAGAGVVERLVLDLWINTTTEVIQTMSLLLPATGSSGALDTYFFDDELSIPFEELRDKNAQFGFTIKLGSSETTTMTTQLVDLILMPSDEWVGKLEYVGAWPWKYIYSPDPSSSEYQYMVYDPISSPKSVLSVGEAVTPGTIGSDTLMQFRVSSDRRMEIAPERRTRVWFAYGQAHAQSSKAILSSVQMSARQRYLSARGAE